MLTTDELLAQIEVGEIPLDRVPDAVLCDMIAVLRARRNDQNTPGVALVNFVARMAAIQARSGLDADATLWLSEVVDNPRVILDQIKTR
ncbi:hypothetical protein [Falsiruegeria litorea]|uniref:hypothetical protein n=1 Tax=Falsiruegeria litorea TaxID=1280831 RepID=UPI001BFE7E47|nr:hypothetical protein [Falsiruegeria litorea]MBT8169666.1 hypothetical protein [Falsiruegeria litorea]